ncbi:MAG: histidine kinase, partial [Betaproteobacteria bacterium]
MFKPLSLLIFKTPWWGMLLGGVLTLLTLVLFALPFQAFRLSATAGTPQEKQAIQFEINRAFKDSGLSVAEGVVAAMKDRAQDPDRRRELERALAEIERARHEVGSAQDDAAQAVREAAQEALDTAHDAAQSALEVTQEARQTIEESRDEALQRLRSKNLDVSATEKSFADLLASAKEKEAAAQAALDAIALSQQRARDAAPASQPPSINIAIPSGAVETTAIKIDVPVLPQPPAAPLPPQLRDSIRATVVNGMWRVGVGSALILVFIPLFVMLLIAKFFIDRSHRALAFAEEKQEEAQLSDMRRQMTEARLQTLQAQVEPHFLYNTLANVQALTEVDPPAAHKLVGHLIEYLRAALPKMRESRSTVGQEIERARAYLNILKMRMGERLAFDIQVPEDLLSLPFPPMMLPTLVENAIKHGLEPRREGGRIELLVKRESRDGQDRLLLQVSDTGAGLSEQEVQSGGGVGL